MKNSSIATTDIKHVHAIPLQYRLWKIWLLFAEHRVLSVCKLR